MGVNMCGRLGTHLIVWNMILKVLLQKLFWSMAVERMSEG